MSSLVFDFGFPLIDSSGNPVVDVFGIPLVDVSGNPFFDLSGNLVDASGNRVDVSGNIMFDPLFVDISNNTTFKLELVKLSLMPWHYIGHLNVVNCIKWSYTGTYNVNTYTFTNITTLEYPTRDTLYTEYDDLTESIVTSWLIPLLDIDCLRKHIDYEIYLQLNPNLDISNGYVLPLVEPWRNISPGPPDVPLLVNNNIFPWDMTAEESDTDNETEIGPTGMTGPMGVIGLIGITGPTGTNSLT